MLANPRRYALLIFFIHGLLSIFLVRTWFVPDEFWQCTEIAHKIVFGYGYETWEWQEGIRSAAYPLIVSFIYWLLKLLSMDYLQLLIFLPRIGQVILTSISYLYACDLARYFYGREAVFWTGWCLLSSWVLFYCMSRTLYNSTETALMVIGLKVFPWHGQNHFQNNSSKFVLMAALSTLIRPTAMIVWLPLSMYHLVLAKRRRLFKNVMRHYIYYGLIALALQVVLDYVYYKRILLTPYRFVTYNFLSNLSAHYGIHPWHWYLTQGIPLLFTTHFILLVLAICLHPVQPLVGILTWMTFVYSLSGHKEFRFLLPVVPIGMCIIGGFMKSVTKRFRFISRNKWKIVMLLFVTNIPIMLYFGLVHQSGSMNVVAYLASEIGLYQRPMKAMFLMPCHSTPFYSHVHENVSLDFLTCEPNLRGEPSYVDEADRFYLDPVKWLDDKYGIDADARSLPTHFVLFDSLADFLGLFFQRHNYSVYEEFFQTHFPEGRASKWIQVWSRPALATR